MEVHDAATSEIDAATLYRILALRSRIFVVEQQCLYLDLDGRDLEPGTRQYWIAEDGEVIGTLRVLADPDGHCRIGRVATAEPARGRGVAAELMRHALDRCAGTPLVLDAQTYLRDWYTGFGFVAEGADFLDDGIPHVTMRRAARADP